MSGVDFLKHICSYFCFVIVQCHLLFAVHCLTSSAATWSELSLPEDEKASHIVQSSIYFICLHTVCR